jgi:hypothetical protein
LAETWNVEFDRVRFDAGLCLDLPATVRLDLLEVEHEAGPNPARDYTRLLNPVRLPRLTSLHLTHRNEHPKPPAHRDSRRAAVRRLAPQLTLLELWEEGEWVDPADARLWSLLTQLKRLDLVEPMVNGDWVGRLGATALASLPHSLDEMNLCWLCPTFSLTARNVIQALEQGRASVAKLRALVVPSADSFEPERDVHGFHQALAVKELIAVAKARGVKVTD